MLKSLFFKSKGLRLIHVLLIFEIYIFTSFYYGYKDTIYSILKTLINIISYF